MLLTNYARVLRELGRLSEAADYVERAYARAVGAGDEVVTNQALILRSTIYRERGDLGRAARMLDEVEPRLRLHLPPTHIAFASTTSERAMIAQARGDLQAASTLMDRALAMVGDSIAAGGQGAEYLPIMLTRRAGIRLQLGRAGDAVADARQAVARLTPTLEPGRFSALIGRAYAVLGRAQLASGAAAPSAAAAFTTAAAHLEHALGTDNSETAAVRELAATLLAARR